MHSKEKEELGEILLPSESSDKGKEEDNWEVNGRIEELRAPRKEGTWYLPKPEKAY